MGNHCRRQQLIGPDRETVRRLGETSRLAIRYEFEPRLGQSFARNAGIEAVKGAVILFTDDDILPDRTWVSGMLSALTIDHLHGVGGECFRSGRPPCRAGSRLGLTCCRGWPSSMQTRPLCSNTRSRSPGGSWGLAWRSDARSSRNSVYSRLVLDTEGAASMDRKRSNSSIG